MKNALNYAKMLKDVGIKDEHAEAHINVISDMIMNKFATKDDLEKLEIKLTSRIDQLDVKIDNLKSSINLSLDLKLQNLESKMTIKLGSIMVAGIAVMIAVQKIL